MALTSGDHSLKGKPSFDQLSIARSLSLYAPTTRLSVPHGRGQHGLNIGLPLSSFDIPSKGYQISPIALCGKKPYRRRKITLFERGTKEC